MSLSKTGLLTFVATCDECGVEYITDAENFHGALAKIKRLGWHPFKTGDDWEFAEMVGLDWHELIIDYASGHSCDACMPIIWRREEAEKIVEAVAPKLAVHSFNVKIVGSVATAGRSHKDLDLLLTPLLDDPTIKCVLQAIDVVRKSYPIVQFDDYDDVGPVIGFKEWRGRWIDVFLSGVPEEVWDADSFKNQMWNWLDEDRAAFLFIRRHARTAGAE
jgi:hypothetical protein